MFTKTSGQMAGAAVKFFFVGVAVAVIEETFFRGALQGALQRRMNVVVAMVLASAVYSAMHFLKPNGVNIPANQVTWASGGQCLVWVVTQSLVQKGVFVGFVSLFLAGLRFGIGLRQDEGIISVDRIARGLGAGQRVHALVGDHRCHAGRGVLADARGASRVDGVAMSNGIQTTARPRAVQLWARRALDLVWPRNCPFCGCPLADTDPASSAPPACPPPN